VVLEVVGEVEVEVEISQARGRRQGVLRAQERRDKGEERVGV
jgi:hypothetical protein